MIDSLHIKTGNPFLKPQIKQNLRLSYFYNSTNINFSSTLYFKKYNDIFGKQTSVVKNRKITQIDNIGQANIVGLQIVPSFRLFKRISINSYLDINYQNFFDNRNQSSGFAYYFSLTANFNFKHNIYSGIEITIPSKNYYLQGYYQEKFSINALYIGKQLFKNYGNITVLITNPLNDITTIIHENYNNYSSFSEQRVKFTMLAIKFTYSFHAGQEVSKLKRAYNMEKDM